MHTRTETFWVPKRGNANEEYEDAFGVDGGDADSGTFRCAVADGATETSYSRQWARALARAYCAGKLRAATFATDVAELRKGWQRAFARHVGSRQLPWYAEQKASLGAFAALVGLEFHRDGDGDADPAAQWHWQAVAVGDCNLFQVRSGSLVTAFPLTRADQFSGGPFLIGSNDVGADDHLARRVLVANGDLQPGDTFHLASDALACWFLRSHELGERPWQRLESLAHHGEDMATFAEFVAELRDAALLHNDDVTLVRIAVETAPADEAQMAGPYWIQADETTPF